MEQKFYTFTIHSAPRRHKQRRVKRNPVAVGMGLALLLSVGSIAYTLTVMAQASEELPDDPVKDPIIATDVQGPVCPPEDVVEEYRYEVPAADPEDMKIIAQTIWGEARGVDLKIEQEAVAWCIFNRVDDSRWPDTIKEVCTPDQFNGYDPKNPVESEFYEMAFSAYNEWQRVKLGDPSAERTLPAEYVFMHGDGDRNFFRTQYKHTGEYWEPMHSHYITDYIY